MDTLQNDPAMPIIVKGVEQDVFGFNDETTYLGLTKREQFAAIAMQGLMANPYTKYPITTVDVARIAVLASDALISELNKQKEEII